MPSAKHFFSHGMIFHLPVGEPVLTLYLPIATKVLGAQWLSGRVLDSRPRGCGFETHRRHCVVSLSKNINPSLVLVQLRKTRPFITERFLGRKESNQTKQSNKSRLLFSSAEMFKKPLWQTVTSVDPDQTAPI